MTLKLGTAQIIQGNALNLPLPNSSVDLICTSPPYFGLRSYQDGGQHYNGQIGSEPTPAEFLDALLAATREMMRVLKPSGSLFVNLGDKYAGSDATGKAHTGSIGTQRGGGGGQKSGALVAATVTTSPGVRAKSLIGIPWRYAIQCIDQLGLILRAEIIWAKPNGLPESVTDRVRRSHEQWFHLTKQPRYYSAVDEIREPHLEPGRSGPDSGSKRRLEAGVNGGFGLAGNFIREYNPLGKLPGSVWSIPSQPLTVPPELGVDHFAAYPMEWPRRIIQGWTPNGVCTECGEGRRPALDETPVNIREQDDGGKAARALQVEKMQRPLLGARNGFRFEYDRRITGYVCGCPTPNAPTTPAVCLDPFGGTGTTALVAKALGRTGITIDLSADYCRLATWRCNDPRELAAALQVEKPDPVHPDQLDLFSGIE